jgi:polyisoprenoid-binding protein YceI
MSKQVFISIGIVILVVVIGAAVYVLRPTAEASQPIEAEPIQAQDSTTEESQSADMAEETESEAEQSGEADTGAESEQTSETEETQQSALAEPVLFSIVQAESQARFTLDELLRGNPKTVIGETNQVAGEISVDFDNPANSQVGLIQVNARTLVTDSDFRNRAIKNEILDTGEFEFISFQPTLISGLPESVAVGETLTFKIEGELTIRDISNPVGFEVNITVTSKTTLSGYASTSVARADYDLQIPSVPSVADVDEEVLVEIEFTAVNGQ